MKIILPGREDRREIRRFWCWSCDCVFDADCSEYGTEAYPGGAESYVAICPCCGAASVLDET